MFSTAYNVSGILVSFPKSNDAGPEYQIAAKVPAGSTKEDVRLMWQSLLEDRFKVKVHRETKEMPVYELILSKGGFKGKAWVDRKPGDPAEVPSEPGTAPKLDQDGFPLVPAGQSINFFKGSTAHFVAPGCTLEPLTRMLEVRLPDGAGTSRPVVDATGLTGKYDLKLAWSTAADNPQPGNDAPAGESLVQALDTQLGLKIRQGKANVETLVVDHIEKAPTEN